MRADNGKNTNTGKLLKQYEQNRNGKTAESPTNSLTGL